MSTKHEETLERLREKAAEEEVLVISEDVVEEFDEVSPEVEVETEPESEETKKSSIREYVVLQTWKEVARIEAGSAEAALKILGKGDGGFAVVPLRNFSVFEVKTETTTVTHVTAQ